MNPRIRRFQRDPDVARRVKVVTYAALAIFLLLLIRLYYLQVVRFEEYSRLAEENRVRLRPIRAPRGLILDRDGEIVADSVPAFTLVCTPVDVVDLEGELALLSRIVALDLEDVKERIEEAARTNPYGTLRLASDLSFDQVAKVEEFSEDIPGFFISYEVRRNYPMGNLFSHVVGYVSEASVQDLRTLKEAGVEFGDFVGKRGVERVYENILHGRNGVRKIEVDALGREKREIERTPPVQGKTVVLTVDADLQRKAAELFRGKEGGVVALDPRTGEVLCLYSSPTFDPNIFPKGITKAQWESLVRHRGHPFQNRVTQGRYSPGSTVKPLYALFALDEGMVSWGTDFFCSGEFTLGDSTFRCWKKGGHGEVSLRTAIVQSCDVYFYNLGLLAGIDSLSRWMKEAGFDSPTGIDLYVEARGFVPTREWKRTRFGERWYDGETVVASIGQGYILVTPLELAVAYAAIASGGKVPAPHLVKREVGSEDEPALSLTVGSRSLSLIRQALEGVVKDLHGTGRRADVPGVQAAGKTGTAQVVSLPEEDIPEEEIDYYRRDHAWFVGYAPSRDPEIVVAVVVEHGGSGGKVAAPIFREIVREYFRGRKQ